MTLPEVSIIIPIYNTEQYLCKCLDSVISQSLKDIEIICVNDGSTDGSGDILEKYVRSDGRITAIHTDNQKPLAARKRGMELAKGKYTCFVDADDFLSHEDSIREMVGLMELYGKDIVQFSVDIFGKKKSENSSGAEKWQKVIPREMDSSKSILKACFVENHHSWVLWNKVFRTDVCRKAFNKAEQVETLTAEDAYLYFLICYYSNSFISIRTEPLYTYRLGSGFTSKENIGLEDFKEYCYEAMIIPKIESFLEKESVLDSYRTLIKHLKRRLLRNAVNRLLKMDDINIRKGEEMLLGFYKSEDFAEIYDRKKYIKYKIFDAVGIEKYQNKYRFQKIVGAMANRARYLDF